MERRSEPLESMQVSILGANEPPMTGILMDKPSQGMSIHVPRPIVAGAAVQLESEGLLLLGEVCYCAPDQDHFRVGVEVRHHLSNLAQLRAWNRQLIAAESPDFSCIPENLP